MAITISVLLGQNQYAVMIAIAVTQVPIFARLLRGSMLAQREQRLRRSRRRRWACGSGGSCFGHVLPNSLSPGDRAGDAVAGDGDHRRGGAVLPRPRRPRPRPARVGRDAGQRAGLPVDPAGAGRSTRRCASSSSRSASRCSASRCARPSTRSSGGDAIERSARRRRRADPAGARGRGPGRHLHPPRRAVHPRRRRRQLRRRAGRDDRPGRRVRLRQVGDLAGDHGPAAEARREGDAARSGSTARSCSRAERPRRCAGCAARTWRWSSRTRCRR